jgi:hypothetical protein
MRVTARRVALILGAIFTAYTTIWFWCWAQPPQIAHELGGGPLSNPPPTPTSHLTMIAIAAALSALLTAKLLRAGVRQRQRSRA